ncbi:hypothetical protein Tco_0878936 [Tanacetum coccineum]|uniref:Uncharacterized protein n=1 Tax=Tanacetum coccineum TaxID=301880 RepID=A0ABQ5BZ88_9ASTR
MLASGRIWNILNLFTRVVEIKQGMKLMIYDGVDDGTESTGDLHLLRDGPAECEDECRGLSDESPDDDSDVVGGYRVDNGAAHQ